MLNKAILIGRLGRDPEVRYIPPAATAERIGSRLSKRPSENI